MGVKFVLTLREEHRLRLFENRVLRRIYGPKRKEIVGGWRRMHNEELHGLYASLNISLIKSRRMRLAGYAARMVEMRNAYDILVGKPEGKRSFGRRRHRWKDIIRMDLMEISWESVDWIRLAQDRDQWRRLWTFGFHKRWRI
jgi:hypothetical protein